MTPFLFFAWLVWKYFQMLLALYIFFWGFFGKATWRWLLKATR